MKCNDRSLGEVGEEQLEIGPYTFGGVVTVNPKQSNLSAGLP